MNAASKLAVCPSCGGPSGPIEDTNGRLHRSECRNCKAQLRLPFPLPPNGKPRPKPGDRRAVDRAKDLVIDAAATLAHVLS